MIPGFRTDGVGWTCAYFLYKTTITLTKKPTLKPSDSKKLLRSTVCKAQKQNITRSVKRYFKTIPFVKGWASLAWRSALSVLRGQARRNFRGRTTVGARIASAVRAPIAVLIVSHKVANVQDEMIPHSTLYQRCSNKICQNNWFSKWNTKELSI